jgi:hypothetical protein
VAEADQLLGQVQADYLAVLVVEVMGILVMLEDQEPLVKVMLAAQELIQQVQMVAEAEGVLELLV